MHMRRTWMAVLAMALVTVAPLAAQQTQQQQQEQRERERQERADLERRMRELQNELRDVQRRLNEGSREERERIVRERLQSVRVQTPRAVIFSRNRGRLGVLVDTERDPARDSIGAELNGVSSGGPAEQAGLRAGDIITMFNGERLTGRYPPAGEYESEPGMKLGHFAQDLEDGDTVQVEYRRGTQRQRATIVARELEPENWYRYGFTVNPPSFKVEASPMVGAMARSMMFAFGDPWLNMELVSLNPELGEYFGTNEGLLVIRAPRDSTINLRSGDVILRIDGRTPSSHSQLMRIFRSYSAGESVQIEIMRQKRRMTVTATIPERDDEDFPMWERR